MAGGKSVSAGSRRNGHNRRWGRNNGDSPSAVGGHSSGNLRSEDGYKKKMAEMKRAGFM